jgi:Xaa-Pro aminopeptidase
MIKNPTALRPEFLRKKLELVRKEMSENDIDLWITFTREGNPDPVSVDLRLENAVWKAAAIFDAEGGLNAIVGGLDVELVRQSGLYDSVHGYGKEGYLPKLVEFLKKSKANKIAINTSSDFGFSDGLSPGMLGYLKRSVAKAGGRKKKLVSAEDLIITLRARLIPEEIELMKEAVEECEGVFRVAEEDIIQPGRTDKEIHELFQTEARNRGLELSWDEVYCPAVVVGNDVFGHYGYSGRTLKDGELIHVDFGVKFGGYCSDLQRVYFVGKSPPTESVRKLFKATKAATDAGANAIRAGVKAYIPDKASRDSVIASGYPEFLHGMGHPIGRSTIEIGPNMGPRWRERYGRSMEKKLFPNLVMTVQPSVVGEDGTMNIEREVLVTETGFESLSKPEEELYLLG